MSESQKQSVSFCMSTFKRPQLLKQTLNSILAQSFHDFELIVSDNDIEGSAEGVVSQINDRRIKYFNNGTNLGMIGSFNKSIERSNADYIVMITDDDPVYPDMLQTLFDLKQEFPGYGMYLGGCDWFCTSHEVGALYNMKVGTNSCLSNVHDINFKKAFSPGDFLQQLFSFGIFPHYLWSTGMVKREILLKNGGVPEYGTPFLGDYAYMSVNAAEAGCVIINKSLGCQTLHNGNFGRNQNDQIVIAAKNFPEYVEKHVSHLPGWPEIKPLMLRFTAMWVVTHMAFLHHYFKQTGSSAKGLAEAEEAVFEIPYIKKYNAKYRLKKNFPRLHDLIVQAKKKISS